MFILISHFLSPTISDRPEPISQPEPNQNYIYKIWTETGTENISEPKQEQEPKINLKGI